MFFTLSPSLMFFRLWHFSKHPAGIVCALHFHVIFFNLLHSENALVPTYFTYIAIEILSGTLRGIGDSWLPMIICCLGICALRVVWILTAVPLKNDILTIVFSYPLTWTVTSIAFIVYYLFFSRLKIVGRKR